VDPTESYRQALRASDDATAEVEAVVTVVRDVAEALAGWRRVIVPNAGSGFGRAGVVLPGTTAWPDMATLALVLKAYHRAAGAARDGWAAVPPGDRKGLRPPPA
jgi:hypothetical protein